MAIWSTYFTAIWYILLPFGTFYCHLVYFTAIWYILLPFGIFYGNLVYFRVLWYILRYFGVFYGTLDYIIPVFGMLYQEKSGTPALSQKEILPTYSPRQRIKEERHC
jgi:hypothetical protein